MRFLINLFKQLDPNSRHKLTEASFNKRPETITTKRASPVGGTGDKWGRQSKKEQLTGIANGEIDNTPDGFTVFTNRQKLDKPSAVDIYLKNLEAPITTERLSKSRAWQRANYGGTYNRSSLFSSGLSQMGSLAGLFDSVIAQPSSASYYNGLINNSRQGVHSWA